MGVSATIQPESLLAWAAERFGRAFAIVTSFQREGMVILDMAVRVAPGTRVLTIDTGRLPQATHEMIRRVEAHYRIPVEIVAPDPSEVSAMTMLHGPDLFRDSVAARSLCCHVRKVRPFERALRGLSAYAVGLRRSQAETRAGVQHVEAVGGKYKLSPLAGWTAEQVRDYIARHGVPEHPLYGGGYATIGCDPCTRPLAPGEDERAGRWWWESGGAKECGLHFAADGRAMRTVDVLLQELLAFNNA